MSQDMFETFNVPIIIIFADMTVVLALYVTKRTMRCIFDSGHGVSHVVPVLEEYPNSHAIQRLPFVGNHLMANIKELLIGI